MTWRQVVVALGLAGALLAAAVVWGLRVSGGAAPQPAPPSARYGDDQAQRLDVYRAPGTGPGEQPAPVVIFIHGGGWSAGDKSQIPGPLVNSVSEQGYAVVSINYRLAPRARFPAQIDDQLCPGQRQGASC